MENIQKLLCEMQDDFICASKIHGQTHQAAASLETIQLLALFSQRCITHAHCARYNLHIELDSRLYYYHACPQNHVNSQNKQGAFGQSECW